MCKPKTGTINMTDSEFQFLKGLKKVFSESGVKLPANGQNITYDIRSTETRDTFLLDVDRRGRIELSKCKLQHRYTTTKLPLIRVDINSPPHINPDGTVLSRNHIHIFKEIDNDTGNLPWAYDLETFSDIRFDKDNINLSDIFIQFCGYFNIDCGGVQEAIWG